MAAASRVCKVCGCTEQRACGPFGCAWVSTRPPICSGCALFLLNLQDPQRLRGVLKYFGIERFTSPDAWRKKLAAAMALPVVDLPGPSEWEAEG